MVKLLTAFMTIILFGSFASSASSAEILIISNISNQTLTEKEIRDLYLGLTKSRQFRLLDQEIEQSARTEFNEKFLQKSERELQQKRSILIFSGMRTPTVLKDNQAVVDYVKNHKDTIGYVTGGTQLADGVKTLLTIK